MICFVRGKTGPGQLHDSFIATETSGKGDFYCWLCDIPVPSPVEGKGGLGRSTCPGCGRLIVPLIGKPERARR